MKRILFIFVALVASISMSAQTVKLYKDGKLVQTLTNLEADEMVFTYDSYVDLGLPSGILWAECNVGASKPEEAGDYFAWGETETQPDNTYSWASYKWCNNSSNSMTKYCTDSQFGQEDNRYQLVRRDDAATQKVGYDWRIPSLQEMSELVMFCTWTWTKRNGVAGYKVVGKNGNSIFLPVTGARYEGNLNSSDWLGNYWTTEMSKSSNDYAYYLSFSGNNYGTKFMFRCMGMAIRPVKEVHEYVDLGLSVKWATCNVGASKPEGYGDYYGWGTTEPNKYVFVNLPRYGAGSGYWITTLLAQDDAASVNWGQSWRMPTASEWRELYNKCSRSYEVYNGVPGLKFTGPNGNSIFLPAAGYFYEKNMIDKNVTGKYWSSSIYFDYESASHGDYAEYLRNTGGYYASCIAYNSGKITFQYELICKMGTPIRPVHP